VPGRGASWNTFNPQTSGHTRRRPHRAVRQRRRVRRVPTGSRPTPVARVSRGAGFCKTMHANTHPHACAQEILDKPRYLPTCFVRCRANRDRNLRAASIVSLSVCKGRWSEPSEFNHKRLDSLLIVQNISVTIKQPFFFLNTHIRPSLLLWHF